MFATQQVPRTFVLTSTLVLMLYWQQNLRAEEPAPMVVRIERHTIDQAFAKQLLGEQRDTLPNRLKSAEKNPNFLAFLGDQALHVAGYASAVDPASTEIKPNLQLAAEALTAVFVVEKSHGKEVTVALGGKKVTYEGQPIDESYLHSARWMNAFYAATIVRDEQLLRSLFASVPHFAKSSTRSPRHRDLFVHALQGWDTEADDTARRFIDCIKATEPGEYEKGYRNYLLRIDVPLISTMFYCITEKEKEFEEALLDGVNNHKAFYASAKKYRDDADGYFSLGLTAIAVEAQARKLPIKVESGYLPAALLK